jgi:psp operon transcriptional activator
LSRRWDQPFVKLNCAAFPENLVEVELFGHEIGAFTGAARRREGRFELADGGTLFLDEIANTSRAAQEKILGVIEYGSFERVGSSTSLHVDVRVIGATNINLPSAALSGAFRYDLLDRLAFGVITVPPVRERPDDIIPLADHFSRLMAQELAWERFARFTQRARNALEDHDWRGNVRELKNVVERAVYRNPPDERIDAISFDPFTSPYRPSAPPGAGASSTSTKTQESQGSVATTPVLTRPFDIKGSVAAFEQDLLERALAQNRHNQRAAARHLQLAYHQFRHKLVKHGLLPS